MKKFSQTKATDQRNFICATCSICESNCNLSLNIRLLKPEVCEIVEEESPHDGRQNCGDQRVIEHFLEPVALERQCDQRLDRFQWKQELERIGNMNNLVHDEQLQPPDHHQHNDCKAGAIDKYADQQRK